MKDTGNFDISRQLQHRNCHEISLFFVKKEIIASIKISMANCSFVCDCSFHERVTSQSTQSKKSLCSLHPSDVGAGSHVEYIAGLRFRCGVDRVGCC